MEEKNSDDEFGKVLQASGGSYYSFEPARLPFDIEYSQELITSLQESTLALGELSGVGTHLDNPHLMIMPYIRKEAVLSSKIEGTRSTLSDVLRIEREGKKERKGDIKEVENYVEAMEEGIERIKTEKISVKMIKELHQTLMKDVRGGEKDPGQFKTQPNWIGGADIINARFVPASPKKVPELMENLIDYLNNYDKVAPLIKAGVAHYQFESIHPFRDGNGRLGRLMIILYLIQEDILSQPLLYLSAYFEKTREEYNQRLFEVSKEGRLKEWLNYFLAGIGKQSKDAAKRVKKLDEYKKKCRKKLQENSRSTNVLKVLEELFSNPYITVPQAAEIVDSYYSTGKNQIDILKKNDILEEVDNRERNKMYVAPKILEILEV